MKSHRTILLTLLFLCMLPFAMRGCAATLFQVAAAPLTGQDRESTGSSDAASGGLAAPQAGAVAAARVKYDEAEKSAQEFARNLRKRTPRVDEGKDQPEVGEIDRHELRQSVAKAFEARQDLLQLELAEFQSRMKRLRQQLADRNEGRQKIIERRVDELLTPNLRWDEPSTAPAAVAENKPDSKPSAENDSSMMLRKGVAFVAELQGTWLAIRQGSNGELRPFKQSVFTLTFRDNKYEFREGPADAYSSGTFTVDPVFGKHNALDLTRTYLRDVGPPVLPQQPHVEHSIMQIEGDTLTMCSGGNRANDRPDEFTTAKDDGRLLMIYRRISARPLTTDELKAIDFSKLQDQPSKSRTDDKPTEEKPLIPIEESYSAVANVQKVLGLELHAVKHDAVAKEPFKGGLQVDSIVATGPAAKAGIRVGDIVVGAHVWEVLSLEQLQYAVDRYDEKRRDADEFSTDALTLHVVRSREMVREAFRASVPLPNASKKTP